MSICARTGLTIPECSCSSCLEEQLRRVQPSVLTAKASPGSSGRARRRGRLAA